MEVAVLEAKMLELAAKGTDTSMIADLCGLTRSDAAARLSRLASSVRSKNKEVAAQAYMLQHARLEWIWSRICQPALDHMAADPVLNLDHQKLAICLKVMERQSRLTGCDEDAKSPDPVSPFDKQYDDDELRSLTTRFGIEVAGTSLEKKN
jgi:hypothetical protein